MKYITTAVFTMFLTNISFGKTFHNPTVKGALHEKVFSDSSGGVRDFYRVKITDEYRVGARLHKGWLSYGESLSGKKTDKKLQKSAQGFCKLQGFDQAIAVNTRTENQEEVVVDGTINGSSEANYAVLDPNTGEIVEVLSSGAFSILSNVTCK